MPQASPSPAPSDESYPARCRKSGPWCICFYGPLCAEGGLPPAAIFRDENRGPNGQEARPGRSRQGGIRTEGSAKRRIRKPGKRNTPRARFSSQPKEIRRSRPISRVLSRTIIHLGPPSPAASSNLPESTAGHGIAFLFGLAPGGVYHAAACYHLRGALLPHHFTLTSFTPKRSGGGIFSVALSVGSRPPGVTWHPALWSPDFPPRASPKAGARRLPGRLPVTFSPTQVQIDRYARPCGVYPNAE